MQMNNTHCELLKTLLVLTNTSSGNLTFCNHHASRFFFLVFCPVSQEATQHVPKLHQPGVQVSLAQHDAGAGGL